MTISKNKAQSTKAIPQRSQKPPHDSLMGKQPREALSSNVTFPCKVSLRATQGEEASSTSDSILVDDICDRGHLPQQRLTSTGSYSGGKDTHEKPQPYNYHIQRGIKCNKNLLQTL